MAMVPASTMRRTPTAVEWANLQWADSSGGTGIPSSISLSGLSNPTSLWMDVVGTGFTAGRFWYFRGNNNAAGFLAFTAEL
jgi:hypothetical protein